MIRRRFFVACLVGVCFVMIASAAQALDITEISLVQSRQYQAGVEDEHLYDMYVEVSGSGISDVVVTDPYGVNHQITESQGRFEFSQEFATLAELTAAYGPGLYTFTFNGGEDSIAIPYAVDEPTGFANITYPAPSQQVIDPNPTYTWDSVAGKGDDISLSLGRAPYDDRVYDVYPIDINATARQLGPIDPGLVYTLRVSVFNIQGGTPLALQTDQGDWLSFYGVSECANSVSFRSAAMPDMVFVRIILHHDYLDGVERPDGAWAADIVVLGGNLTQVAMTDPSGNPHSFARNNLGQYVVEERFQTLEGLFTTFSPGDYTFSFNDGLDSKTIAFALPAQPATFAPITYPYEGQQDVPPSPTCTWDSVAGGGDALFTYLRTNPAASAPQVAIEVVPADIASTSWQPGKLDSASPYRLEVHVANLAGGAPQTLQTDQGSEFQFVGAFSRSNTVTFATGLQPVLTQARIVKSGQFYAGYDTGEYRIDIIAGGYDIVNAVVEAPSGVVYQLMPDAEGWSFRQYYASAEDLEAEFGTGSYAFSINDGAVTAAVGYTAVQPLGPAQITYPADGQEDVPSNLRFAWDSAVGLGEALGMKVKVEWDDWETWFEEWPVDIATTSWQPGELEPYNYHQLHVAVLNGNGGLPQTLQTDQGAPFEFTGLFVADNCVEFSAYEPLDIREIQMVKEHRYEAGVEPPMPYDIEFGVEGTGIFDVSVTRPDGEQEYLWSDDEAGEEWRLNYEFDSADSLDAAYPSGDYVLDINYGGDSRTIHYTAAEPAGFAAITYPAPGQQAVELDPTFTWSSAAGMGDALAMWVDSFSDLMGQQTVYDRWPVDTTATSWQPGPLDANTQYAFEISVANAPDGVPQILQTSQGRTFQFVGVFLRTNTVRFDTSPPRPDTASIEVAEAVEYTGGAVEPETPFAFRARVEGTGITAVSMQGPLGPEQQLQQSSDAGRWEFEQRFATADEMLAAFGPGVYRFTLNGGVDTAEVMFQPVQPSGVPQILSPVHQADDASVRQTFQWESAVGLGNGLVLELARDPSGNAENVLKQLVDIAATTCEPGVLQADVEYAFTLRVINLQAGGPQPLASTNGDPYTFTGVAMANNTVTFWTAPADVRQVFLIKSGNRVNGIETADSWSCEASVWGVNLTSVDLQTPGGTIMHLEGDGSSEWHMDANFATEAERDAAFGPGDYIFSFNGGADTVTVSHSVAKPSGFASITYPAHNQVGVDPWPTCFWNSAAGLGRGLALFVRSNPDSDNGNDVYQEWPADINRTSWTPGGLEANSRYAFEVAVANFDGDTMPAATETDGGDPFEFIGVSVLANDVCFQTAPLPDIIDVGLRIHKDFTNGVPAAKPFGINVWVRGVGITSAVFEDPSGTGHSLENHGGNEWSMDLVAQYASLAEAQAAYPSGLYRFGFNGWTDGAAVTVASGAEPTGYPVPTYPVAGQHGVSLNPTFTWASAAGFGDVLGAAVVQQPGVLNDILYEAVPIDIAATSWQPGPLQSQAKYRLDLSVYNVQGGTPQVLTTDRQDQFEFFGLCQYVNQIPFDTLWWKIPGDINGDCRVNVLDLILVRNKLMKSVSSGENWWADVNNDGKINVLDLIQVRNKIGTKCPG